MRSLLVLPLILGALACRSGTDTAAPVAPVAPAATDARAARCTALQKQYDDAQQAYYDALRAAVGDNENPSPEDWKKIQEKVKEPDSKPVFDGMQKLVDEDPQDLAAFHAISWMLSNAREPSLRPPLVAQLEKHHMDRPEMGDLCPQLGMSEPELVARLAEKSPHRDVRGRACLAVAEGLKQDIATAEELKDKPESELSEYKKWLGEKHIGQLQSLDPKAVEADACKWYERVAKDYGDVVVEKGTPRETTLGKQAAVALHEMRDLAVGKPAPEIAGVDLDKAAFKLSDYRGKVVLLDFWGNW